MSTPDDPRNLLNELETLQRVLDDAASDQVDHTIPTLEPLEDIPVLDDLFAHSDEPSLQPEPPILSAEPPALRAVPTPKKTATQSPAAQSSATQSPVTPQSPIPNPAASAAKVTSGNPFLPQAILDRLAHEREAAQYSAEQAQATMAKIMANSPDEPLRFDHEKPSAPEPSSAPAALRPAMLKEAMLKEAMAKEAMAAEAATNISHIGGQPGSANNNADQQAMSILDSVLNGDHSDDAVEHSLNSLFGEQPEPAPQPSNNQAAQAALSARLSSFEKARLIDELVDEMLPLMEAKLRAALKDRLG